ncbi:hypothetical protein LPJ53_002749 [Coemansia erecta]|uniref:Uncharacterized protein n=1 Tax=Coemansia erecta TaxID=147472 RepID=A0A9W7XXM3_9FUNG|nr:hypothetical protein LPJ53_002749 [Coemansia erecta]
MDAGLKKTFDAICTVPGSVGAVMIREDGEILRASGDMNDPDEAFALSNLMKDAAQLVKIALPEAKSITRLTVSRQSGVTVVATLHHNHVFGVKQVDR